MESAPTSPESVTVNVVLSTVIAIAFVVSLLPLYAWIKVRNVNRVTKVFTIASLWAGILNCTMWIGFSTLLMKTENCMELVLGFPLSLVSNYIFLTLIHAHKKQYLMVGILAILSIPSICWSFYAVRLNYYPPGSLETAFGIGGLVFLGVSHLLIIRDLHCMDELFDHLFSILNILPNGVINGAALYVVLSIEFKQSYLAWSLFIGASCALLEFLLVLSYLFHHLRGPGAQGGRGSAGGGHGRGGDGVGGAEALLMLSYLLHYLKVPGGQDGGGGVAGPLLPIRRQIANTSNGAHSDPPLPRDANGDQNPYHGTLIYPSFPHDTNVTEVRESDPDACYCGGGAYFGAYSDASTGVEMDEGENSYSSHELSSHFGAHSDPPSRNANGDQNPHHGTLIYPSLPHDTNVTEVTETDPDRYCGRGAGSDANTGITGLATAPLVGMGGSTGGSILRPLRKIFAGSKPSTKRKEAVIKYKDRELDLAPVVTFDGSGALCVPRRRLRSFARGT